MGFGRTKQNSIRYNTGTSSAWFQHFQKQYQKQKFCFLRLCNFQQILRYDIVIKTSLKRWICQNQTIFFPVRILIRKAVSVFNIRIVHSMSHHIHGSDTQHGPVHIKSMEHMIHIMLFIFSVKKYFFLFVFFQIFTSSHQETRRSASRVTDDFIRFRIHQFHHHFNDMSWCSELSVYSCCC